MPTSRDALRDTGREARINRSRVSIAILAVIAALGLLSYRYYTLQIVEYDRFLTESERNRVRLEAVPPKRGLITDRRGRLLATNVPTHRLSVIVERAGKLDALLARLDQLIGIEPEELERFQQRRARRRPYDPVPLKLQLRSNRKPSLMTQRLEPIFRSTQILDPVSSPGCSTSAKSFKS